MSQITLTHRERPAYLDDTVLPSATIMKPMFDGFSPSDINLDLLLAKAQGEGKGDNGVQEAYYAGLLAWLKFREDLSDIDLDTPFAGNAMVALGNFTFRERPGSFIDSQLQSALSAPTILLSWLSLAKRGSSVEGLRWTSYHGVPRDDVIDTLQSDWFPTLVSEAGETSGGLYRNSTGYKLNYKRFIGRSVMAPLRQYYAERPDGQFPIVPSEADELGEDSYQLSGDFKGFLKDRMRRHNLAVAHLDPEDPVNRGTSRGCPYSQSVHFVSNAEQLDPDLGHSDGVTDSRGKQKITLDWDANKQVCQLLADVLLSLDV